MYQLRGRVGRAKERAYAYLLVPGLAAMGSDARKRLEALQEVTELGSGLKLAMHDLEIRGAGALLGDARAHHNSGGMTCTCRILGRPSRN
jgi:transcription-repair coupling factor (superfamily II helicase)